MIYRPIGILSGRSAAWVVLPSILTLVLGFLSHGAFAEEEGLDGEKKRTPIKEAPANGAIAEPVVPKGAKGDEVKPGDKIDKTNAERIKELVSPGVL